MNQLKESLKNILKRPCLRTELLCAPCQSIENYKGRSYIPPKKNNIATHETQTALSLGAKSHQHLWKLYQFWQKSNVFCCLSEECEAIAAVHHIVSICLWRRLRGWILCLEMIKKEEWNSENFLLTGVVWYSSH